MAVTPDVKLEWVKRTPWISPEDISKKARVNGSLGPRMKVCGLWNYFKDTTYELREALSH